MEYLSQSYGLVTGKRVYASLTEDKTKPLSEHVLEEIAHICMYMWAWEYEVSLC